MTPWQYRPNEIANLLNPAFCAEVLRRCIHRYQKTAEQAFPYVLLFFVLPIILHHQTRKQIKPSQNIPLHAWLQSHQEVKIDFAERVSAFLPFTKEATLFLLQVHAMNLNDQAQVSLINYRPTVFEGLDQEEIADCFRKAEILGRWFARAGTPETIYIMWGVKP